MALTANNSTYWPLGGTVYRSDWTIGRFANLFALAKKHLYLHINICGYRQLMLRKPNGQQPPNLMGNVKTIDLLRLKIFILTIFCFCSDANAQTDECQVGTDSAKSDYSNGILRTYIFGLTNSFTFGKMLRDDYGIDAIYWGDIVDEKWECYSKFMDKKIREKFGEDIFDKVAKKSQQLDNFGKGDRQSEFPGGETDLMKFVYCNLDLMRAKYSADKKGKVYLQFAIDTTGRPVDIQVMKSSNEDYSREAVRLINLMPNWTTATQNGKTIKQKWNLPIVFDNEWKEKHCP